MGSNEDMSVCFIIVRNYILYCLESNEYSYIYQAIISLFRYYIDFSVTWTLQIFYILTPLSYNFIEIIESLLAMLIIFSHKILLNATEIIMLLLRKK